MFYKLPVCIRQFVVGGETIARNDAITIWNWYQALTRCCIIKLVLWDCYCVKGRVSKEDGALKHQDFVKNSKQLAPWRKNLYYLGLALIVLGLLCVLMVFVQGISAMNQSFIDPGFMAWGLVGFVLFAAGGILREVGARGLAGAGVILDPEKAREDLHPYTDALGGMARDAVDSFKAGQQDKADQQPQVMLRCRNCQGLNPESALYCNQCGQKL